VTSSDDVTPPLPVPVQSPDIADRRPPTVGPVDRKLSPSSSSLPQLSRVSGSRQQPALDETGSNNLSLGALHDATGLPDAAARRQTLIRSHACRPCHDLSKVTAADRPSRFGSHFRLTAAVADVTPDDHDRSSLVNHIVVCDPAAAYRTQQTVVRCTSGPPAEVFRPADTVAPPPPTALYDGESLTGRTIAGRGGLAVLRSVLDLSSNSLSTTFLHRLPSEPPKYRSEQIEGLYNSVQISGTVVRQVARRCAPDPPATSRSSGVSA